MSALKACPQCRKLAVPDAVACVFCGADLSAVTPAKAGAVLMQSAHAALHARPHHPQHVERPQEDLEEFIEITDPPPRPPPSMVPRKLRETKFAGEEEIEAHRAAPIVELELADRGTRFWAFVINSVVGIAPVLLIAYAIFSTHRSPSLLLIALGVLLTMGVIAVQGMLMVNQGRDIGKLLLGMRVVDAKTEEKPDWLNILILRNLPWTISMVPLLNWAWIVDAIFIFGDERRCLHDRLASTIVVKA